MEFTDQELEAILDGLSYASDWSRLSELGEKVQEKIETYFKQKTQSQALYSVVKIQQLALLTFNNQLDNLPRVDETPAYLESDKWDGWKGLGVIDNQFAVQGDYIERLEQNEMSDFAADVKRLCVFKS